MKFPKYKPAELIEELREAAYRDIEDMRPSDFDLDELVTWEAADMIQAMHEALTRIAGGEAEPQEIAKKALS